MMERLTGSEDGRVDHMLQVCASKTRCLDLSLDSIYLMMPFFNRNWAGVCRGRWAGPGLLAGWDAGFRIVGDEVGSLLLLFGRLWMLYSPARTRNKGGRRGLRPWPFRCRSQFPS